MTISPDQLQNAIEGLRALPPGDAEVARLVRLAGRLDGLLPDGPSLAQTARMSARFEEVMSGEAKRPLFGLFGLAPAPGQRPLVQRFAAGALLIAAVGGGASAATGVSPAEAARATLHVAGSAIRNLAPHGSVVGPLSGAPPAPELLSTDPTVTNGTPAATAAGGQTPAAGTTSLAGAPPANAPGASPGPTGVPAAAGAPSPGPTNTPGATQIPVAPTPVLGGGVTPTPTPRGPNPGSVPPVLVSGGTPTPGGATPSATPTGTDTPTPTGTPSSTATPAPSPTPSPTPTVRPRRTPTDDGGTDE